MIIRKISIGPDYKSGAMHYIVGQDVLSGNFKIHLISQDESGNIYVYILDKQSNEIYTWKKFNQTVPVSLEYDIEFNPND